MRIDSLPSDPDALKAVIRAQASELAAKGSVIEQLKAELAVLKRARFGTSSEKLARIIDQLELALGECETDEAAAEEESAVPTAARAKPEQPARHRWSQYFAARTWATRPGPGLPRSIGSRGGGACIARSHERHTTRGRTCRITRKDAGTYSSHLRDVLAALQDIAGAAVRARRRGRVDDRLARQASRSTARPRSTPERASTSPAPRWPTGSAGRPH